MTDIERHIIRLLLDYDCVIVPGLGGFMAHNIAASYDDANHVFIPPSRTVGFNPRLTMNDSLLAQAYVNCYDISYPEALRRIEHDVDVLKQLIEKDGELTICGVGNIAKAEDGEYNFTPESSGIITPCLYGLEPYEIKMREHDNEENSTPSSINDSTDSISEDSQVLSSRIFTTNGPIVTPMPKAKPVCEEPKRQEIAVRIPISFVKHMAAACVIIFVLLSFPSKLGDSSTLPLKQSSISTSLLYEIMPKDVTIGKPENLQKLSTSKEAHVTSDMPDKAIANDAHHTKNGASATHFCIVLASRITKTNAHNYVEKLRKKGLSEVCVHTNKAGVTMVTYSQFSTRAEANVAMKKLSQCSEFADCWIAEIK